jgi:hypothetical protein
MARFNEILAGRYNRFLQKLLQLKGGPPASQLASEIMPVFPFFSGRENRFLEGWSTFGFTRTIVGVAAVAGACRIRNPVGSNLVAVFEKISVGAAAVADQPLVELQATTGDLITPFQIIPTRWDARQGQNSSTMIFSDSSGGSVIGLQAKLQGFFTAGNAYEFINTDINELPLLPGDAIQVQSNVANQAFVVSWLWRERQLEDSELKI